MDLNPAYYAKAQIIQGSVNVKNSKTKNQKSVCNFSEISNVVSNAFKKVITPKNVHLSSESAEEIIAR